MVASIIVGIIGIVFVTLGYMIWKKEKITLLHDYHYDKVLEEDKKAFCTLSGVGVFIIGCGLLVTAVIVGITDSAWSFIVFGIGFVVGFGLLILAGVKYN